MGALDLYAELIPGKSYSGAQSRDLVNFSLVVVGLPGTTSIKENSIIASALL
jgi:hypothetical protein